MGIKNIIGELQVNGSPVVTSEELESLSKVSTTGLISDLEEMWDIEIVFDGGDFDIKLAKLDTTQLV